VVPLEKLQDYVLNPDHPIGQNKARVFKSMLGIERKHSEALAEIIKASLPRAAAKEGEKTQYGQSWETYHEIIGTNGKSAIVTVAWMFLKYATRDTQIDNLLHRGG